MGMTMISNEEYKDLILKEQELEKVKHELECATELLLEKEQELKKFNYEFNALLLMLTDNKDTSKWEDEKFEPYDLADRKVIADYINDNYVEQGKLILKENNND